MSESTEDLLKAYIEQLIKIQQENRPVSDAELKKIAADMGIDEQEMAFIQSKFNDYLTRGLGYSRYEDWESAIEELQQAVMLNPNHIGALYGLAKAFGQRWFIKKNKNDLQNAKNFAKRCLQIQPDNEDALRLSADLNKGVNSFKPSTTTKIKNFLQAETSGFKELTNSIDWDTSKSFMQDIQTRIQDKSKTLHKSVTDKLISGVCGGLGEYLGIDPTLVRIIFIIGTFAGVGFLIPVYILLAIILPRK